MWESIYEKYYGELVRYALSSCKVQVEAEDLVQEVFVRAMHNELVLKELGPSQKRAWLYRCLKNLLCDRFRKGQVEMAYLTEIQEDAVAFDPGLEAVENRLLLDKLTSEDRTLFYLRFEEGYNAAELAEMFGVPAGTIRARLSRMRKNLKKMIE